MSSRLLVENTERVRDELSTSEIEGEEIITIKGSRIHDHDELYTRSVIGTTTSSLSSSQILDHILAEGVTSINIKPIGGLLHLISFESYEDKKAMIESHWLEQWFSDLRNVNDICSAKWRKTYIRIYGVPLIGRGYENFYNIGSIFGRVILVDNTNFECSNLIILTDCLFSINCKLAMEIGAKQYIICIAESYAQLASIETPQPQPLNPLRTPESSEPYGDYGGDDVASSIQSGNEKSLEVNVNSPTSLNISANNCMVTHTISPTNYPQNSSFPNNGKSESQLPKYWKPKSSITPPAQPSGKSNLPTTQPSPTLGLPIPSPTTDLPPDQPTLETEPSPPIAISNKFAPLLRQK